MTLETLACHAAHGGKVSFHRHAAETTRCPMRFAVYTPPQAALGPVPVLYCLAGLTCSEETFMIKAGAQRVAAELGLMLVTPDTSPRVELPRDREHWDFGIGAGFYVDATQSPWSAHYRMASYVSRELPAVIGANFPADLGREGICGHSMGGHGALTIGLRERDRFRSISAFAPIAAPSHSPWGRKAFSRYLGEDEAAWADYDASSLAMRAQAAGDGPALLVDQGLADEFLATQLIPERLEAACAVSRYPLELRRRAGYDHGYYFISSFVEDHLRHHARALRRDTGEP